MDRFLRGVVPAPRADAIAPQDEPATHQRNYGAVDRN